MMTDASEYAAEMLTDAEADRATATDMAEVTRLARLQKIREAEVERAEQALKAARRALAVVAERELPELLQRAGLASVTTEDGLEVDVTEKLYASVARKNLDQACEWLVENGHAAIVSENVVVPFDLGQQARSDRLVEILEREGFDEFSRLPQVHTGRIKALIRELVEAGEEVPLELFGAHWRRVSTVKDRGC